MPDNLKEWVESLAVQDNISTSAEINRLLSIARRHIEGERDRRDNLAALEELVKACLEKLDPGNQNSAGRGASEAAN